VSHEVWGIIKHHAPNQYINQAFITNLPVSLLQQRIAKKGEGLECARSCRPTITSPNIHLPTLGLVPLLRSLMK